MLHLRFDTFVDKCANAGREALLTAMLVCIALATTSASPSHRAAASVSGVVHGPANLLPIAAAQVTLTSSVAVYSVTSDEEGRFEFSDVPTGRYSLRATKESFLWTEFGAFRAGEEGTALRLRSGENYHGITIALQKLSAISGIIRDQHGIGVENIRVVALGPAANEVASATSSKEGVYRLHGLPPGRYRVCTSSTARTREVPFCFPGAADLRGVEEVVIGIAEERTTIDILMPPTGAQPVHGTVTDIDGRPIGRTTVSVSTDIDVIGHVTSTADLGFTVPNLPEARYEFWALDLASPAGQTSPQPGMPRISRWGRAILASNGTREVSVRLRPAIAISGNLHFDSTEPPNTPTPLITLSFARQMVPKLAVSTECRANRWRVEGLIPGTYGLQLSDGSTHGWWLRTVESPDLAFRGTLVELPSDLGSTNNVVIHLGYGYGSVTGSLTNRDGTPAVNYWLALIPSEEHLRYRDSPQVMRTRPDTLGDYVFDHVPAGEYSLAAFTDLGAGNWQDDDFLSQLYRTGTTVMTRTNRAEVVNVRLAGGGL